MSGVIGLGIPGGIGPLITGGLLGAVDISGQPGHVAVSLAAMAGGATTARRNTAAGLWAFRTAGANVVVTRDNTP